MPKEVETGTGEGAFPLGCVGVAGPCSVGTNNQERKKGNFVLVNVTALQGGELL